MVSALILAAAFMPAALIASRRSRIEWDLVLLREKYLPKPAPQAASATAQSWRPQ